MMKDLIRIILLFNTILLACAQISRIERLGKKNYTYINYVQDGDETIILETSPNYPTSERIFYDLEGFKNSSIVSFYNLSINNTKNKNIGKYEGASSFIKPIGSNNLCLLSISTSGYVESTDFTTGTIYYANASEFLGNKSISSFGPILEINEPNSFKYIFSFIEDNGNNSSFVLRLLSFYSLYFSANMSDLGNQNGYDVWNNVPSESSKSKMISCFKTISYIQKIMCLYRDSEYRLIITVYDTGLKNPNSTILNHTGNKEEDDDIFFKGIWYEEEIGIFIYYRNYSGTNPIFAMKKYNESSGNMDDYKNFGCVEIDGTTDFNRHYLLNDIIMSTTETLKDIYYASASQDRETIYFVVFSLNKTNFQNNELIMKYYSIKMFEKYKIKFYKDIKLYIDHENNTFLLFSHCYRQKCEEDSLHYTSMAMFQDVQYDYDMIENLYNTNDKIEDGIMIDLNPYKDSLFGKKVESIQFESIPQNITLIDPVSNNETKPNQFYENTSFYIELSSFNLTGIFPIKYHLSFSDTNNDNEYIYQTKKITQDNRLRQLTEAKEIIYNIKINSQITDKCEDELCAVCSTSDEKKCITCKNGYSFIGEKKYCQNEDGKINMADIGEVYESLKEVMETDSSQIIQSNNAIFQLSTIDFQKNSDMPFISSVDLGECEALIREQEGLADDEDFFMIKMDLKNADSSATFVQYEIYNPNTLEIVNLDICDNVTITMQIPVFLGNVTESLYASLAKYGYQLFNINDTFYNDVCSLYTAENGADMILKDRKTIIYDNNKNTTLCQKGCTFESYDIERQKSKCNCAVQKQELIKDITKISFDKTEFYDSFYKVLKNSNFMVMKCLKLVFSFKGLKNNIGSYMMTGIFVLFIVLTVIYFITGQKSIREIIKVILEKKQISDVENTEEDIEKNKIKEKGKKVKKDKDKDKKEKDMKERNRDKKRKSTRKKSKKEKNNEETVGAPVKRNIHKRKSEKKDSMADIPSKNDLNDEGNYVRQKSKRLSGKKKSKREKKEDENIEIKSIEDKKVSKNKQNTDTINNYNTKETMKDEKEMNGIGMNPANDLNDEEMNNLKYEEALLIDKRSYFGYYYSLLKKKHLILFIFLPSNDYNLIPIKFVLFLISFSMFLTVNAFFFTDDTMNKIYEDNGIFNFIFHLPQIIYSSVVSTVIDMILKKLSLSEDQILNLKKEKDVQKVKEKAKKIQKCLKIRFILFLLLTTILMLFFWYFISCFCAVYTNTQMILLKDTFVSFGLSMAYPFVINLFPGFFRIPALRAEKKDQKCLFKLGNIVAII